MWMLLPAVFFLAVLCLGIVWLRRTRFPYLPDAGPYYIADGRLVLNYKIPEAHALCRIARVELSRPPAERKKVQLSIPERAAGFCRTLAEAVFGGYGYERFANDGIRIGQAE